MKSRKPKQYNFDGLGGCVVRRKARKTGTLVGVYHGVQSGMECDRETPWVTVCEEHGNLVGHRSLRDAMGWAADPEMFCEDCRPVAPLNSLDDQHWRVDDDEGAVRSAPSSGTTIVKVVKDDAGKVVEIRFDYWGKP